MRSLFVTTEIYPYVKTGGLGDVCAALPPALQDAGVDVRILVPGYKAILDNLSQVKVIVNFPVYFGSENVRLLQGFLPEGLIVYVFDAPGFYARAGAYLDPQGVEWEDNHYRFAALCRIAADFSDFVTDWTPDVIHCHDWQGGLIPAYLKFKTGSVPKTVITIHNLAYQGLFPPHLLQLVGLPPESFSIDGVEFYNKIGYLKSGLVYADHITTVSPTYAEEIKHEELGCGLDGVLSKRSADLTGILNGIDDKTWNPATDTNLPFSYDVSSLPLRNKNKAALLQEYGLVSQAGPLFGVVSRLSEQKGFDLLLQSIPFILEQGGQLIVLGSGDKILEAQFRALQAQHAGHLAFITDYNEALAHKIQAAADIVLMPSRFEPCGLVQMYAMRYGALPLVRKTGGLADTVQGRDQSTPTGFVFDDPTPSAFQAAISEAFETYKDQKTWLQMQINGMKGDYSWKRPARLYADLYKSTVARS